MANSDAALAPRGEDGLDRRTRWTLIRKAVVFQVKLMLDGIKDLVLSPMVLVALLFDLFKPTREPGENLGRVFRAGLVFEEWLDMYAPARDPDVEKAAGRGTPLAGGFDAGLSQVEALVVEQFEKGQISDKAKAALEGLIGAQQGAQGSQPDRSKSADSDL